MQMNDERFKREMMYRVCLSLFSKIEDMTDEEKARMRSILAQSLDIHDILSD